MMERPRRGDAPPQLWVSRKGVRLCRYKSHALFFILLAGEVEVIMGPTLQPNLQLLYNTARFSGLLDALDELHSAASDGNVRAVTPLSNAELVSWLYEVIYTAQETMNEIESKNAEATAGLTLVRKSS